MKIAILSYYSHKMERGAENWAAQLAKNLNHEVKIFAGIENESIFSFTLRALEQMRDYSIVIPVNGRVEVILTRLYCWLSRKKMIVVGHSGKGLDERINLYCFPDVFVGLSEYACTWAKKINPFIKIKHIPNGVDLELFTPKGVTIDTKLKKPIVIAVGAFEKSKQLDLTIQAVAKTENSLLLLGSGSQKNELVKLCEQLLPGRYTIKSVNFSDMPRYYRSADIFALTSWNSEAYPLVYLEAMACNLPVVATDDQVRREIVGEAGFFVNPFEINSYAQAIKQAVNTDWKQKPRLQAEKFSWAKVAHEYEKMFISL